MYPWSSYLATVGAAPKPDGLTIDWVLGQFSRSKALSRKRYAVFVAEGVGSPSSWSELKGQTLLGGENFIQQMTPRLQEQATKQEVSKCQRMIHRPTLEQLFADIKTKADRNETMARAYLDYGYTQAEISVELELHYATVSRLIKAMENKISKYKM